MKKHQEITKLVYDLWIQRGRPIGSPEEDWYSAEEEPSLSFRRIGPVVRSENTLKISVHFIAKKLYGR